MFQDFIAIESFEMFCGFSISNSALRNDIQYDKKIANLIRLLIYILLTSYYGLP